MVSKIPIKRPYKLPLESNNWGGAYFDGVLTSYIDCGSNASLKPAKKVTLGVSLKIVKNKTPNGTSNYQLMGFNHFPTFNGYGWWLYDDNTINGTVYVFETSNLGVRRNIDMTITGYSPGKRWQEGEILNVTCTAKTDSPTKYIGYFDGINKWSTIPSAGDLTYSGNCQFGKVLNCILYEVYIIGDILTQPQIQDLMYGRILPTQFDCRLWHDYRLGHARDLSGNGNHGTLNGNVRFV